MKQTWQRLAARIDALGLRERVLVFLCATVVLIALINAFLLTPLSEREAILSKQIAQDQSQISGMQTEIRTMVAGFNRNADAGKVAQLAQAKAKLAQMHASLDDIEKGLVSPEHMTGLLEDLLKQNIGLHLVSLHTLPPQNLIDPAVADKTPAGNPAPAAESKTAAPTSGMVYKHGVEIVIEGSYLDMVNYMSALEHLPWRLYWGEAKLDVDESAKLKLTLTLYTLSLDKKWLNI